MKLAGLRVLVTRPVHQAEDLCAAIEDAGGHALRMPLLHILDPTDPEAARAALRAVADADDAVFTSRNAVDGVWRLLPDWRFAGRLAAVGAATARQLAQRTGRDVLTPEADFSSEGLLRLPRFRQVRGRRIVVVGGEGGRDALRRALSERGAEVQAIAVYRRERLPVPRQRLQALLAEADAAVVTSGEALQHLIAITPPALKPTLWRLQLVVPSERVLKLAREAGFQRTPLRPQTMADTALVAALAQSLGEHPPP